MDLRGRLGFLEDQVKLAIMAFQEGDANLVLAALTTAKLAADEILKSVKAAAA